MKAIIENIQHFSLHDGPGTRTTVFFKGCPLRCIWCSNPTTQNFGKELLQKPEKCLHCGTCVAICPQQAVSMVLGFSPQINRNLCNNCGLCTSSCPGKALLMAGKEYTLESVVTNVAADILFYRNSGGGVTLSGGEVLAHCDFAVALCEECHNLGIQTAVETSGYAHYDSLKRLSDVTDILFMDIKHADSMEHKRLTGVENRLILENFSRLLKDRIEPIHVRLPLIPGCNESDEHLAAYADLLSRMEGNFDLEVLPYHRLGKDKYDMLGQEYALGDIAPLKEARIVRAVSFLRANMSGMNVFCIS